MLRKNREKTGIVPCYFPVFFLFFSCFCPALHSQSRTPSAALKTDSLCQRAAATCAVRRTLCPKRQNHKLWIGGGLGRFRAFVPAFTFSAKVAYGDAEKLCRDPANDLVKRATAA
jgi:hypothetical protein